MTALDGDCDDDDPDTWPGAPEVCGDGVVNDCDGGALDATRACGPSGEQLLREENTAWLRGESREDEAGFALDAGPDLNGDGLSDLIIGAWTADTDDDNAGAAYLVSGLVTGTRGLGGAAAKLTGASADQLAGYAVASLGDTDGDGHADVAVGAPGDETFESSAGVAYVARGPLTGTFALAGSDGWLLGETTGASMGSALAAVGDTDGDGLSDVVVGAFGDNAGGTYAGTAYLFLGPVSGAPRPDGAQAALTGERSYAYAGYAVGGGVDLDGDGLGDLLVGARADATGGSAAGSRVC